MSTTRSLINTQCQIHKKTCQYICSYSKCSRNLICEKCRRQHLQIHPAQFIYELSNLHEIHTFNKIDKLKQMLIKQKLTQQSIIRSIYKDFDNLTKPLNEKVQQFSKESRSLIEKQLSQYLRSNKNIIEDTEKRITKSNTDIIRDDPNKILQQTIEEAQIINKKETRIIQNGEKYKWLSDTTKNMCEMMVKQISSMINVAIKIIDNSMKLQKNGYLSDGLDLKDPNDASFYKRYPVSTSVAMDKHQLEAEVLQSKNILSWKDNEITKAQKMVKEKMIKIQELNEKVDGLREQLIGWQQKAEIEERQKRMVIQKERKKKQQILIKNGIIGSNGKSISLQRKVIAKEDIPLILQIVPNPICLDLSNNNLTEDQLQIFLTCSSLQILKFNFTRVKPQFMIKLLHSYPNLTQLQLNSAQIDDSIINLLSRNFPPKIKVLYLIDNRITDDGLENMFINMYNTSVNFNLIQQTNKQSQLLDQVHILDQLYVSYNRLTSRSIETIFKYSYQIKKLHISKNQLKVKGGQLIGKHLQELEELFIGATGIIKDGFLQICKQGFVVIGNMGRKVGKEKGTHLFSVLIDPFFSTFFWPQIGTALNQNVQAQWLMTFLHRLSSRSSWALLK